MWRQIKKQGGDINLHSPLDPPTSQRLHTALQNSTAIWGPSV